jgi:hypothetical protein
LLHRRSTTLVIGIKKIIDLKEEKEVLMVLMVRWWEDYMTLGL